MTTQYNPGDTVLGNWTLIRMIGAGSYGRVFEAERKDFGTIYKAAIKIITIPQNRSEIVNARAEGMDDDSVTAYFRGFVEDIVSEIALMSRLKGTANIVAYEDHTVVQHTEGVGWDIIIRMELLSPLVDYTSERTYTRQDVIKLGMDMCKALELCQRFNIIHRDIKPENIFISDMGDYKLGDFGIARTVDKTMDGLSRKGTFTYMAPEIYRDGSYGSSVDIYSLGIVLYRLLNDNRAPFLPVYPAPITHSDREAALAKRISGAKLPAPNNADGRLAEIVLKACAYDPKDRYSSPMLMRQELEAILYSREEAPIIYPNGDETPIKSVEYAEDLPRRAEQIRREKTTLIRDYGDDDVTNTKMNAIAVQAHKYYSQDSSSHYGAADYATSDESRYVKMESVSEQAIVNEHNHDARKDTSRKGGSPKRHSPEMACIPAETPSITIQKSKYTILAGVAMVSALLVWIYMFITNDAGFAMLLRTGVFLLFLIALIFVKKRPLIVLIPLVVDTVWVAYYFNVLSPYTSYFIIFCLPMLLLALLYYLTVNGVIKKNYPFVGLCLLLVAIVGCFELFVPNNYFLYPSTILSFILQCLAYAILGLDLNKYGKDAGDTVRNVITSTTSKRSDFLLATALISAVMTLEALLSLLWYLYGLGSPLYLLIATLVAVIVIISAFVNRRR